MHNLMKKHDLHRESGQGGFTLIELLVVIAILGILAAIVVFSVGGITDRGEDSACKSTSKTVEVGAEAFRAKNGTYPASLSAMATAPDEFLKGTYASNTITLKGGKSVTYASSGAVTNNCP